MLPASAGIISAILHQVVGNRGADKPEPPAFPTRRGRGRGRGPIQLGHGRKRPGDTDAQTARLGGAY